MNLERSRSKIGLKILIVLSALTFWACSQNKSAVNGSGSEPENPEIQDKRAASLIKYRKPVEQFFEPMRVREGDWLKTFKEEGQTFEEYVAGNPTLPTGERRVIYIQPIGNFTATQKKVLRLTAEYMEAFFNLPVRLNEVRPLGPVPREMRRKNPYEGQDQIRTGYFLDDVLPKMLPGDAAALICFTDTDLFPDETFNYVFGQASLSKRVGAWSLWRFGDPDKSPEDYALFLKRVLKVGMHETGHMFSMAHCTKYECLMSGSNHLQESDRRPLDLCPECMLKIAWGMNYAPADRYGNLKRFWEKLGWEKEAGECARKEEAVLSVN